MRLLAGLLELEPDRRRCGLGSNMCCVADCKIIFSFHCSFTNSERIETKNAPVWAKMSFGPLFYGSQDNPHLLPGVKCRSACFGYQVSRLGVLDLSFAKMLVAKAYLGKKQQFRFFYSDL